jgi:hypothetical protein
VIVEDLECHIKVYYKINKLFSDSKGLVHKTIKAMNDWMKATMNEKVGARSKPKD